MWEWQDNKEVLGIFVSEFYKGLRESRQSRGSETAEAVHCASKIFFAQQIGKSCRKQ